MTRLQVGDDRHMRMRHSLRRAVVPHAVLAAVPGRANVPAVPGREPPPGVPGRLLLSCKGAGSLPAAAIEAAMAARSRRSSS